MTGDGETFFVLRDADVRTMAGGGGRAECLAWVDGGELVAVGDHEAVTRALPPDATIETRALAGATVVPGFIDAHHHPAFVALWSGGVELRPPVVRDIPSLQRTLAEASKRLAAGEWLFAVGWDEMLLAERRQPTRAELDDAVPDRPLMAMHYSCHRALANSRALELVGVDRHTPDPPGGKISRGRGGLPDGLLIERAMCPVEARARASLISRDVEGFLRRLAAHHQAMAAAGITRVADLTVPSDLAALYREAASRGLLIVPTIMAPVSLRGYLERPHDILDGPGTGAGDDLLSVGPIKLVFDGAPVCSMCMGWWQVLGSFFQTCLLMLRERSLDPARAALSVRPRLGADLKFHTGIAMYDRADAAAIIRDATASGFAVATHAVGNAAVDTALTAYEATGAALARHGAPRIEHAAFIDRALVDRIARSGAAVVSQPYFVSIPSFTSAPGIPGMRFLPHRWLLDAGVKVAGSSDFPVDSFDPLAGIRAAVTRQDLRGRVHEADQRVSLEEALQMYTRSAAEVCGCLDRCGTIEPGKRADLVVLDGPLTEASLDQARVRATVIGGRLRHGQLA